MPADLQKARDLFLHAVGKLPPDAWDAYVVEACGEDVELKQHLSHLLKVHLEAGSFLAHPAVAVEATEFFTPSPEIDTTATVPHERPGTMIGPYKLLQQIGEGGMGTVYMAEQTEPVKRKVALKIIKAGMDSKQVIARFEAERQALAMMDHVNIARVFDGGTTEPEAHGRPSVGLGRPYFVMELVHGVPITKYCDDNHLTPRQRLELFVPVCQAIQHAHQKGIIHRDIKPSNVMVTLYDGKPVPKVIDFGVAKATEQKLTERTLFTQYGTMVGTLEYMSPEQAEMSAMGVDTRSDIYSLGVLLYELLAGSTPLTHKRMKEAAYAEILRMIKDEEPPKPSTRLSDSGEALASISARRNTEPAKLSRLMRGELDWIVMKTLEKDRNRRYETANAFAADVQRYLADETVQACPPSAGYRFRKFARRNKQVLVTAAVVSLVILLAVGTLGWAMRDREAREQDLARKAERDLALTEQGVRQAVDQAAKIRGELLAVLTKPGGVQELLNQPGRWNFLIQSAQSELAQARRSTARAETRPSAELLQALYKLEEQLNGDEADRLLAMRLEKIRMDRATWIEGDFDYRTAAAQYLQAFAGLAVLNEDAAAVAAKLRSSSITEQLVAALDDWALVAAVLGNKPMGEKLLAVARQTVPDPAWGDRLRQLKVWSDPEALGELVAQAPATGLSPQFLNVVGFLLFIHNNPVRESWLRQAQAVHPTDFWLSYTLAEVLRRANSLEAVGFFRVALAIRPTCSSVYIDLANALADQKKLPEAVACYCKAIEFDPKLALAHSDLSNVFRELKKLPEAIAASRKAIELDPKLASAHNHLGNALQDLEKLDEAIACHRKAIELNPKLAQAHNSLGLALSKTGKPDEAIAKYREAIRIKPDYFLAHSNLGASLYNHKRDYDGAKVALKQAIHLKPDYPVAHFNLGNVFLGNRQHDEAGAEFKEAIRLKDDFAEAHCNLAEVLLTHPDPKRRDPHEALRLAKRGVEIAHRNRNSNEGNIWNTLGVAHYRIGEWTAAVKALDKSMELRKGGDSSDWFFLAMAHWQLGDKVAARNWYDKANEWMIKNQPKDEELRRLQSEAAALLSIQSKPMEGSVDKDKTPKPKP